MLSFNFQLCHRQHAPESFTRTLPAWPSVPQHATALSSGLLHCHSLLYHSLQCSTEAHRRTPPSSPTLTNTHPPLISPQASSIHTWTPHNSCSVHGRPPVPLCLAQPYCSAHASPPLLGTAPARRGEPPAKAGVASPSSRSAPSFAAHSTTLMIQSSSACRSGWLPPAPIRPRSRSEGSDFTCCC